MAANAIKRFLSGCIGAVALTSIVHAADAPGSWLPPPDFGQSAARPTELLSGWYLRGDIAYRFNRVGSVEAASPIVSDAFANTASAGLGVGYKYQWFRSDITFDYAAKANYRGTTAAATTQPQYASKLDSFLVLANVYFDLGTWAGLTPYVGAGAGASHVRSISLFDTTLPAGENVPTGTAVNFAWAAMAGISYQILPTWLIDVGYRYASLGETHSGLDSTGNFTTWRKLSSQEVRIGFRLLLD